MNLPHRSSLSSRLAADPLSLPAVATINHLLAQEGWARQDLRRHAGKVACVDAPPARLRLRVTADGLLESAPADAADQVTIRLKLSDLPLMAQNRARAFSYVRIEGDAEFANAISSLSQALRWDAEHDLERVLGPVAAVRAVAGLKALLQAARNGHDKLAANVAEFLLDEQPTLLRPQVVESFSGDVVRLRDDVERAAKRLARLEQLALALPKAPQ